ncbi:hypothetical protein CDD83_9611 [Cordyceps sp. RAO-2017]|nr:hypothetical protein CDD83_9611 [Cordyceps sp. RAO-2017]
MAGSEGLEPPERKVVDPGARQLSESSDEDDQFTDAQSGPASPHLSSPVPKTRIEKVDNEPSHGQVPGTEAYQKRGSDAQPDEIAVMADEDPETPLATASNENDGDIDADLETPLAAANNEIPSAPSARESPTEDSSPPPEAPEHERIADAVPQIALTPDADASEAEAQGDNDDFGDDFDDFEEGALDDDFDDFEDGFQQAAASAPAAPATLLPQPTVLPFPIPDFDGLSPDEVLTRPSS